MKEQVETRELKEGRYVIIDDEGIFDGQKRSIVQPVTAKIYVPIVERKSGQVLTIGDTSAQLMDNSDYSTIDIPITAEDREKLEEGKEVSYLLVMGRTKMDMR